MQLEADCFEAARRVTVRAMRRSLTSPHQEVWVATTGGGLRAALVLRFHQQTCRIHSIAVDPAFRGRGLGGSLLQAARRRSGARGCRRIHLEADSRDGALLAWYGRHGYIQAHKLPDHYAPRWHAWRLRLEL